MNVNPKIARKGAKIIRLYSKCFDFKLKCIQFNGACIDHQPHRTHTMFCFSLFFLSPQDIVRTFFELCHIEWHTMRLLKCLYSGGY